MALNIGQEYQLTGNISTGSAPGQSQWQAPAGSRLKIKNTRNVNGQVYYDIDQTAFGGGTGWTPASALEGAVGQPAAPTSTPIAQPQQQPQQQAQPTQPAMALPTQPQYPDLSGQWDKFLQTINSTYQPQIEAGNAEMKASQDKITARTEALNAALAKINDNPYYSEATRVGRARKLQEQYNNDVALLNSQVGIAQNKVANVQNQISQAKADAQVKLNIDTQMYNIKNSQYQQNLQMVNSLLTTGALNNASGADIAQIATTTGMSTSMVQSIIDASKKSKEEKPKLETIDDGTNQYVVAFDSKGNVINKQVIANSKPKAATADDKLNSGNFNNAQISKAIKILAEADVATNPDDTGDKLLSAQEQQQALLKIQSEIAPDPSVAFQLLQKAAEQGGFGDWTG